jgi:hypothetical protein
VIVTVVLGATAVTVVRVAPIQEQALLYRIDPEQAYAYGGILDGALVACRFTIVSLGGACSISLTLLFISLTGVVGTTTVVVSADCKVLVSVSVVEKYKTSLYLRCQNCSMGQKLAGSAGEPRICSV